MKKLLVIDHDENDVLYILESDTGKCFTQHDVKNASEMNEEKFREQFPEIVAILQNFYGDFEMKPLAESGISEEELLAKNEKFYEVQEDKD